MKSNPQEGVSILCHTQVKVSSLQMRPLISRHNWRCSILQSTVVYFYFSFKMFHHYLNVCHLRYEFYCVGWHGSGSCLFHVIYNWNSSLKDYQCCWATIQTRDLLRALEIPLCYEYLTTQEKTVFFLFCYAGNGIQSIIPNTLPKNPAPSVT